MVTLSKLVAYLSLDKSKYEDGLKEANHDAEGLGSKLSKTFGTVAKVTGAAMTAGAAAVGKLVKDSVSAFGEFQQLEGGIQTLFGKDAQTMMNNASKAFKTAGVSANQYMEMAIQSSAAMITSLDGDTKRASELMDQSIIDMSDNVNKMGTSMEAVQNAYRGFSRGNFTMLDNLALGFAGTKTGMQELLKQAEAISKKNGKNVKYSIESYADMVEAIHVVQTEMGITGTTAKEAGDTITGSAGSAKAAWEDLKVAIASGNDKKLTEGIDNLINSLTVMGQNIIPIVERALTGVGTMIEKIVPLISERLPGLVEQILPGLLSATSSLINGVVKALPTLLQVFVNELPKVLSSIWDAIKNVAPQVIGLVKDVINRVVKALPKAVEKIKEALPKVLDTIVKTVKDFVNNLGNGTEIIGIVLDLIEFIANTLIDHASELVDAGLVLLEKLIDGIMENLPRIAETAFLIIQKLGETLIEKLPEILERGKEILLKIVQGIKENLPKLVQAAVELIKNLAKTLIENLPQILQAGIQLILELGKGIFEALPELLAQIPQIIIDLVGALLDPENIAKILDAGFQMIGSLFDGLFSGDFFGTAGDIIGKLLEGILAIPAAIIGIGAKIVGFILEGIVGAWDSVVNFVESGIEAILGDVNAARDEALRAQAEIQAAYQGKINQNKRYHDEYGSAYGITGRESFASSNSQADIYASRQRQYNEEQGRKSNISSAQSQAASATHITIQNTTYIGGSKAAQNQKNFEALNNALGGGY